MTSRIILHAIALPAALLLCTSAPHARGQANETVTGTLEKLVATKGTVTLNLQGANAPLEYEVGRESWLTIIVFNKNFRAVDGGTLPLISTQAGKVPEAFGVSLGRLALEKLPAGGQYELAVRDADSGLVLFNVDRFEYQYDAAGRVLRMNDARLVFSDEFAQQLGRKADAGQPAGTITLSTAMYPLEVNTFVEGEIRSSTMPVNRDPSAPNAVPGPDVIVGDMPSMVQSGSSGTQVGLAIATTSCNNGTTELNWNALPSTDHPVIPQNLYRMSGGATNNDRFEQLGQSWLKHAFTALQQNACAFGCAASGTGTRLGVGCSDPYDTSLNGSQTGLGSRAWVNPYTGFFPGGTDVNGQPVSRDHTGHTHSGTSHRILVDAANLNTTLNAGATYFAEAMYVTPHEYAWCISHPGECNMDNNVSYRRFNVTGTTTFTFSAAAATVRTQPAINAWTGATVKQIRPATDDGIGYVAYKVSGPVNGIYHYEYAIFNQSLDRSIQSFSVPMNCGVTLSNVGFRAPLNHPAMALDGSLNSTGYSNAAWTPSQTTAAMTWNSETFAQNQNANALRWGTMFNFRFDSDRPPQTAMATIGFYKTGSPMTVAIDVPSAACSPVQVTTAVSRKVHGTAGTFDLNLPLTGVPAVESRSGGTGGDHTIVVTFNNNVVSGSATVSAGNGSVSGSPAFSGNTMTINLTGVPDGRQPTMTLATVMDSFGQTMPDTAIPVGFLLGDGNSDALVNSGDVIVTRSRAGQTTDTTNFLTDVNLDGMINSGDVIVVRSRSGNSITPVPAMANR